MLKLGPFLSSALLRAFRFTLVLIGLGTYSIQGFAQEAIDWPVLARIQTASQKLSYQGTLIVQSGAYVSSSRVTHVFDANGEYEHIESLDGQSKEWIRQNDDVQVFLNDAKVVRYEKRRVPSTFPGVLTSNNDDLSQFYLIHKAGSERVAGIDCFVLELEPKDALRFGYRLWVDKSNDFLLKAQTISDQKEVLEQVAFSDIRYGLSAEKQKQKSKLKPVPEGWKVEQVSVVPAQLGVVLKNPVSGFKKINEFKRQRPSGKEVGQIVYSDGLALVSVFLESFDPAKPLPGSVVNHGAVRSQAKRLGDWTVMVMGEVPAVTLRQFTNSVELKN
jgi:sigma-E factor negative regulatory protein RseB